MRELGYNEGYQYAHNVPEAYIPQEYLPEELRGSVFYEPGPFGFEKEVAKRLQWWADLKAKVSSAASPGGDASHGAQSFSRGTEPSTKDSSEPKASPATGSPDEASHGGHGFTQKKEEKEE
jgi:hypothetical protein